MADGRGGGRGPPVVLLVDDDAAIRRTVTAGLELEGFASCAASGGPRGARGRRGASARPSILLDLAMPDLDGLEVLRRLRERGDDVPVCVLSARDEVDDRVRGLQAGADDYVVKPFALEEVAARLHALLRRRPRRRGRGPRAPATCVLDPRRRTARRGERDLEPHAPRVRAARSSSCATPARCSTGARLHEEVWGYTFDPGTNVADVFVGYLRRKLEAGGEPRVLHTVRGVGFVLRP